MTISGPVDLLKPDETISAAEEIDQCVRHLIAVLLTFQHLCQYVNYLVISCSTTLAAALRKIRSWQGCTCTYITLFLLECLFEIFKVDTIYTGYDLQKNRHKFEHDFIHP